MFLHKTISESNFFNRPEIISKTIIEILRKHHKVNFDITSVRIALRPILVGIDGQSGSGKSTLADLVKAALQKRKYQMMVDQYGNVPSLDLFLKDRTWRYQKMKEVVASQKTYLDEIEFYDWDKAAFFYQQITQFINGDQEEISMSIEDAFNQKTKKREDYHFKLTRAMIVLIEGKYLKQLIKPDIHFRLENPAAKQYFLERGRADASYDLNLKDTFFDLALLPSYLKYLERYPKAKHEIRL